MTTVCCLPLVSSIIALYSFIFLRNIMSMRQSETKAGLLLSLKYVPKKGIFSLHLVGATGNRQFTTLAFVSYSVRLSLQSHDLPMY